MGVLEILGNKARQFADSFWSSNIEKAAPGVRHIEVAYVPLERRIKKGKREPIGVFVPEVYLMAKAGLLPEQQNNTMQKTPFELAVLNTYDHPKIQKKLTQIYTQLRDDGKAWPVSISKVRVKQDYLLNLKKSGLRVKKDGNGFKDPQAVMLSIKNPANKASRREKIFHFMVPWAAWLVTLSAAVGVTGIFNPLVLLGTGVATYVANYCANEFTQFSVAESLYRDIGWMMSKDYPLVDKVSFNNATRSLVKLAALGLITSTAVTGAWAGALSLPFMSLAPTAFQFSLAGALSFLAGTGTFVGLSGGMRYIWGLSFSDSQIDFSPGTASRICSIPTKAPNKWEKLLSKLNKRLSEENLPPDQFLTRDGKALLQRKAAEVRLHQHPSVSDNNQKPARNRNKHT